MTLLASIASRRVTRAALTVFVVGAAAAALAAPALAAPGPKQPSTKHAPKAAVTLTTVQARGAKIISRHQSGLQKLGVHLTKFPACDIGGKSAAEVTADKANLAVLGSKLAADTDLATATVDAAAIRKSLRVIDHADRKASAIAACGHIQTLTAKASVLEAKLSARVDFAPAGADMVGAKAALADMTAKVADAKAQADRASASLQGLMPDKGDKSVAAASKAALQRAHAQVVLARMDLKSVHTDVRSVRAALKAVTAPPTPKK